MSKSTSQAMLNNRTKLHSSDLKACKKLIRHGSHSFFLASLVLPKRVAIPATALYAFCRIADDLVDADKRGEGAIKELSQRLDAIYAGNPMEYPEDRAMSEVVLKFNIPRAMPDALIEGLSWDVHPRRYETLSDLYDYAARVAGCVGSMMALIMGSADTKAVARACDLGVAMQLTNIARDIGEDARMGRIYLPRQWFAEMGVDADEWLKNPTDDANIAAMCKRLLDHADTLYTRADSGVVVLPKSCRPGIRAARLIYSDIGRELAKNGYKSVKNRAIVPKARKVALLLWAPISMPWQITQATQELLNWPPLQETRFLLKDVKSGPSFNKIEWLFTLFESLDNRSPNLATVKSDNFP